MKIKVEWRPRTEPLAPRAVVGFGAVATRLVARLLADVEAWTGLEGLSGAEVIVVLGPSEQLPWVDGVRYYGRDPAAPELYLPTTLAPTVPVELYAQTIVSPRPLLIEPREGRAFPLSGALPLSAKRLSAWRPRS